LLRAGDDGAEVVEGVPFGEVASLRSYPRLGTLMMRLSISRTPAISRVSFSALSRTSPLLEVPTRVTLPSAAETVIPAGAVSTLMCSAKAQRIFASSSLSASAALVIVGSFLEIRMCGELRNGFHAGVDRHPGSVQNHVVEERIVPIEVERGAHCT
jgi:hypothetical protein